MGLLCGLCQNFGFLLDIKGKRSMRFLPDRKGNNERVYSVARAKNVGFLPDRKGNGQRVYSAARAKMLDFYT
jgi:hypothetical protein